MAVLSLGEVSAGEFVATPGWPSYATDIFTQMYYGVTNELAARCVLLLVAAGGASMALIGRRSAEAARPRQITFGLDTLRRVAEDRATQGASKPTTFDTGVGAVKQPHILVKTAVVASSLLLGGSFVAYHAGAFHRLAKPTTQPPASESSPTSENEPPNVDWKYDFTPPAASWSSPAPEDKPSEGASQPAPTIMSGTKSFTPMHIISGLTPTDTSAPDIVILPNPFAPDTAMPPPTTASEPPPTPKLPKRPVIPSRGPLP